MTALKYLGTVILSFFLFLSLTIFGIAFMLNSTLLNPDFVAAQVEDIDISDLAQDIAEEQIGEQLPEELDFLREAVYNIIDEHEPWLKQQLNTAVYASYDFLLGESDTLHISIPLNEIKKDLRDSLWEAFREQLPEWLPDLVQNELGSYLDENLKKLADEIPTQYLPPGLAGIADEQLRSFIEEYLQDISGQVIQDYIPKFSGLLESVIEPYFDQYYGEFMADIPDELTADRNDIPDDVWEQILLAKKYIGYFQAYYYGLIAFMVLLVAGIILIHRNVKDITRLLGIDLLIYGTLEFAGVYAARHYLPTDLPSFINGSFELPESFQTWLSGLYSGLLAPLQAFSLGILIAGVVLIVVSIVYRRSSSDE